MNPNQNGAVIPNALREQAADRRADDQAADDRDAVDARHPAEQLVRDGPLAHDGRRRAPDEGVGAEDDQRGERDDGEVVSASDRWVAVSMIRPARMMSPSEKRRSSRPYETIPITPPTATAVVRSPNPTAPMPSRSLA